MEGVVFKVYKVTKYITKGNRCPFDEFVKGLAKKQKLHECAQIATAVRLLEEFGYQLPKVNKVYAKHLEGRLYELRPGSNRIIYFYCTDNEEYVLLHGFHKTTQKTPKKELEKAKKEMLEFERMNNNE